MPRSLLILAPLAAVLVTVAAMSVPAQAAVRDCNAHTANITITSARGMSCRTAQRDMRASLNRCCATRFKSRGGFYCHTHNDASGRCVRGRRAYRFQASESE